MIETVYYKSPVGVLRISADETSLHEINFTDIVSAENIITSSEIIKECIIQLDKYFAGDLDAFTVPVTYNGTPFQQKVWNLLKEIPYGRTISYLELSKRLGDVKSIRAAGTANGKNRIAIVVPCHRVIGSNGTLVGYAGELWRKKWLLDHEARVAFGVQELFP